MPFPHEPRHERIQASPRFSNGVFRNPSGARVQLQRGSGLSTVGEFLFGGQRRVPKAPLPAQSPLPCWARAPESGLRATWLGHSTVLLEIDGMRLLTDPVWSERASPVGFAGPRRFQPVPVPIAQLPPLDAVLISHDHYDHLDKASVLALARTGVPFVTALGVGAHLESWGIPAERIVELDWWESFELGPLTITAAPSQHFSGRGVGDRNRTLWSSLAVRGPRHAFFFSGDTGLTDDYREIQERLGRFHLVTLEVGAFHPAWGTIHLGPENALTALSMLGGGAFLPVHWGTFNLAIHAWDEPAETLLHLGRNVPLLMPRLGAPVEPSHDAKIEPWWREISVLEKKPLPPQPQPMEIGEPID